MSVVKQITELNPTEGLFFLLLSDLSVAFNVFESQAQSDKNNRALSDELSEARAQNEELRKHVAELEVAKSRGGQENAEISRNLEEAESKVSQLSKAKKTLEQQLDEAKKSLEDESKVFNLTANLNSKISFFQQA